MIGRCVQQLPGLRQSRTRPSQIGSILAGFPVLHGFHHWTRPAHSRAAVSSAVSTTTSRNAGEQSYTFKVQHTDAGGLKGGKVRLDTYLSLMLAATAGESSASRAKVQDAIKAGLVSVNGRTVTKASVSVKVHDSISATLLPAPPLEALPEDIPLNIVYEDDHLMVVNKPAGMPVHISVGHHTGTLVNALLYHCGLPGVRIDHTQPSAIHVLEQQQQDAAQSAPLSLSSSSSAAAAAAAVPGASHTKGAAASAASDSSQQLSSGGLVVMDPDDEEDEDELGLVDVEEGSSSTHMTPGQALYNSSSSSNTTNTTSGQAQYDSSSSSGRSTASTTSPSNTSGTTLSGSSSPRSTGGTTGAASSTTAARQGSDSQEAGTQEAGTQEAGTHPRQQQQQQQQQQPGVLRPGIVHRLDMGTSGLLVVAKQEGPQRALSAQFKERTVSRIYLSLTVGCPTQSSGRVLTNIDRDTAERKRQAAYPYGGPRGRPAASNYSVVEALAGGAAALVQWKLETGRTHQIRVHARHIGHPLIGDTTYGGAGQAAVNAMARHAPGSGRQAQLQRVMSLLQRPALHARSLGFTHPVTGQRLEFDSQLPEDFEEALQLLRSLNS